uniref:Cadherin N-terminal domain-containing protein n=1 Tax=Electrophorus electricus TaxID=8005 RepID=A0AAY5E8Z3_ELEEL
PYISLSHKCSAFNSAEYNLLYSVSEELKDGAVVGNIAKDLGIDYKTLKERGFRVVSSTGESLFEVNQDDGILYLSKKVCETTSICLINLKIFQCFLSSASSF